MSSPANQFDNPEVFEAVMGQIGPQMMLFAAKVIDYDHQIDRTDDPEIRAVLRRKRQEAVDEVADFISNFLTNFQHQNPAQ